MILLEVLVVSFFLTTPCMVVYLAYQETVEQDNQDKLW